MKKQILSTILLSGLVLAVGATKASATVTIDDKNVVTSTETYSDVEVKLIEDDGNKPGEGPFMNNLAIAWVPKLYSFSGSTTDNELILKNTNSAKEQQAVTVNDDREDKTKWTLSAQMSKLTTTGGAELDATMKIKPDKNLRRYDIGEKKFDSAANIWDYEHLPIDHTAAIDDSGLYKLTEEVVLASGATGASVVINKDTAGNPTGDNENGVTAYVGESDLIIDAGNAKVKGDYTGTVYWTLAAQE